MRVFAKRRARACVRREARHLALVVRLDATLASTDCDVFDICLPNHMHARTVIAAAAGKHVIIEKPLCLTLGEASDMIAACRAHDRKLMYAEELCFAPKYERVRQLVREGAVGSVYYMRQCEKHSGPHSDWFYDLTQSGGGALMDMGCHGFAWLRWMLGAEAKVLSVYAQMQTGLLHAARTRCEENSLAIVEFQGGVVGIVENSWAKLGGMEDRVEVCGTGGVVYADLFMGNSALTYSEKGYGYAMEKAGSTQGWTFTNFEEAFNQGYPQELQHFIGSWNENAGDDEGAIRPCWGSHQLITQRIGRKVSLPFGQTLRPVDLWLGLADEARARLTCGGPPMPAAR